MRHPRLALLAAVLTSAFAATSASAVGLVAVGKLSATASDLSGLSGALENGVRGPGRLQVDSVARSFFGSVSQVFGHQAQQEVRGEIAGICARRHQFDHGTAWGAGL